VAALPLFPLPGTVVFPGMTVPLYIFEERYKRLVSVCLGQERPRFVITLSKVDEVIRDEETPFYRVGTVVHILQVSQNPDGTYNILGHGQERCLVEVTDREDVKELDGSSRPLFYTDYNDSLLQRGDPNEERLAAWDALETFQRYAKQFFAFQAAQQIEEVMPDDLVYQASFICANIRVPADSRQVLLESPSLTARFQLAQKLMLERITAHEPAKDLN
jgi:uncharacterized protein